MPIMINFWVNTSSKSMLSITNSKNCCIIKSMSSIIEFISLNIQIMKWRDSVAKRESAIWRLDCFNMILKSENVKLCLFLRFRFLFLRLLYDRLLHLWGSGRVLDSRPRSRGFEPHGCHFVLSLSKNINPSLVLVQPRKTCPFITERLLMGRKE